MSERSVMMISPMLYILKKKKKKKIHTASAQLSDFLCQVRPHTLNLQTYSIQVQQATVLKTKILLRDKKKKKNDNNKK